MTQLTDDLKVHSAEEGENSTPTAPSTTTPALIVCKNTESSVHCVKSNEDLEKAEFHKKLEEAETEDEKTAVVNEYRKKQQAKQSYETVRLKDEKFKTYLSRLLYETEEKVLNHESASQVILF